MEKIGIMANMAEPRFAIRPSNIWQIFSRFFVGNIVGYLLPTVASKSKAKIAINPEECTVWMVGHATVLINFYGTTILTDPVLVNTLPFPKRILSAPYTAADLPNLDLVLISHAHMDHLNIPTLNKLAKKTKRIIIPTYCSDLIDTLGFEKIAELDWNHSQAFDDISITAYKPEHWGKRLPWETNGRHYNSYIIEHKKTGHCIFFCGDSGYGNFFKAIGQKNDIDIALLPIAAYNPSSFLSVHMDPKAALKALKDLQAKVMIPIHWGNFRLSLEPIDEPPKLLSQLARKMNAIDKVKILRNGESFSLPLNS